MIEQQKASFKELSFEYLNKQSLMDLRAYGRFLSLPAPTYLNKKELIGEITAVLCEEKQPLRTKRGAPIKNDYYSAEIPIMIEKIKKHSCGEREIVEQRENESENGSVSLQFTVIVEKLTAQQKQLLTDFLNSL